MNGERAEAVASREPAAQAVPRRQRWAITAPAAGAVAVSWVVLDRLAPFRFGLLSVALYAAPVAVALQVITVPGMTQEPYVREGDQVTAYFDEPVDPSDFLSADAWSAIETVGSGNPGPVRHPVLPDWPLTGSAGDKAALRHAIMAAYRAGDAELWPRIGRIGATPVNLFFL